MKLHQKEGVFYVECSPQDVLVLTRPGNMLGKDELKEEVDTNVQWQLADDGTSSYLVITPQFAEKLCKVKDTNTVERELRALLYESTRRKAA